MTMVTFLRQPVMVQVGGRPGSWSDPSFPGGRMTLPCGA